MQERKIPKKNGGHRLIVLCSKKARKRHVKNLKALGEACRERCPYAHGFVPGRSPVTAARAHAGFLWTLNCDLRDFFDRCNAKSVKVDGVPVKKLLYKGRVAQGLPCSPAIANLSVAVMDEEIAGELRSLDEEAVYTRYADDLTISSNSREVVDRMRAKLPEIAKRHGHECHPGKWRIQSASYGKREVCGVMVGDDPDDLKPTRAFRRRLRVLSHKAMGCPKERGMREWARCRRPVIDVFMGRAKGHLPESLAKVARVHFRDSRYMTRNIAENLPIREYLRAWRWLEINANVNSDEERVRWACGLALTFGQNWKRWIDLCNGHGEDVHNACFWLQLTNRPDDGLGKRLIGWAKSGAIRNVKMVDLEAIARSWSFMSRKDRSAPLKELLASARAKAYKSATHTGFAVAAAKANIPEKMYKRLESRWIAGVSRIDREAIPRVRTSEENGMHGEILMRDDPRSLFAGYYTDCCQHPRGAAASSAWHGAIEKNGAVFAIFNSKGEMVAQSWMWRSGSVVVCDSIEILGRRNKDDIASVYEKMATLVSGKLGIERVLAGSGAFTERWTKYGKLNPPKGRYSDAHGTLREITGETQR